MENVLLIDLFLCINRSPPSDKLRYTPSCLSMYILFSCILQFELIWFLAKLDESELSDFFASEKFLFIFFVKVLIIIIFIDFEINFIY